MIPRQFYDTDPNYDAYSFMGIRSTYELKSIPINTQEFTQAYWVGWVGWETLPQHYHISNSSFENGVLTFTDITKPENVPIGFSTHPTPGNTLANYTAYAIEYDSNQSKWYTPTWINSAGARGAACDNFHLPNAYDVNTGSWGRLKLLFFGLSSDNTTEIQASAEVPYMSFASGASFNAIIFDSGAYNNMIFNVTIDDISEYSSFKKTINNTEFNIVLGMYTMPYVRDCGYNNSLGGYNCVHPMVQVHTVDDFPYVIGVTNPFDFQFRDDFYWGSSGGVSYNGQGCRIGWDGSVISLGNYLHNGVYDWFGGYVGSFTLADMPTLQLRLIVPNGANFYMRGIGRNDFFIMGRIFTHDEILHSLSLFPRLTDGTSNRYENSANYFYGVVDSETSEFKGTLVDGTDITKLVDWQIVNNNIEDNTITVDNIPEYVPPEEDLPDAYGSDVLPDLNLQIGAIGGFITQYCMTASQVASFGSYLWANIFSIEFLQSVGTMIANDFSINPSDILKYIVSLRCYPFDLANVRGFNSDPDTIYFGRGVVGIPTAGIGTMDNLLTTFGGENITVPRLQNDFRDYEPYTRISLNIPFCGQVELTPSEVVGKDIFITYTVDFSIGAVQANVWVKSDVSFIIASASGSIAANIQISASNGMEFLQKIGSSVASFIKTVGTVAAIAATAGAASDAIGVEASEPLLTQAEFNAIQSKATANAVQAGAGITEALVSSPEASSLPIHSKSVGGGFTSFSTPRAYLIVERRKYVIPSNYNHVYGKACNFTTTLDQVKGFTVCKNVDLEGFPATQDELAAIESLLTSGVYF